LSRGFKSARVLQKECRQPPVVRLLDELREDFRYAARILRKSPEFTLTAVLTLAMAIGFNCAAFSVLNTVLLHAPPYPEADRMVELRQANAALGLTQQLVSVPDYLDWSAKTAPSNPWRPGIFNTSISVLLALEGGRVTFE